MTFKRLDEVLPFFGMDFEEIVEQGNKEINKQAEEIMANTNTYKGMYAVDFCYQNILMGNKNYILPAKVWHCHHANSQSKEFWRSLKNIVLKYQNTSIKDINTTCVEMKNSILVFYWLQLKQRIRVFIKNVAKINESNLK